MTSEQGREMTFASDLRGVIAMGSLGDLLAYMQSHGSSVLLNWGEDTNTWECSWISSGERTTTLARDPETAVRRCARRVLEELS